MDSDDGENKILLERHKIILSTNEARHFRQSEKLLTANAPSSMLENNLLEIESKINLMALIDSLFLSRNLQRLRSDSTIPFERHFE